MSQKVVRIDEGVGTSGGIVPETGTYAVAHEHHRLPPEVTLVQGQPFPRCQACAEPVRFRLRRRVSDVKNAARFRVFLYQLPVLDQYGRAS
jgi:hypothetical protein